MEDSLLWSMLRYGMTENRGFFLNLKSFRDYPLKVARQLKSGDKNAIPSSGRKRIFAINPCNHFAKMYRSANLLLS